jgi:hypothetical protein
VVAPKAKEPGAPEPRQPPLTGAERADTYAALCNGVEYLDRAQDAFLDGEDDDVRDLLEVLAGLVKVVAGRLSGSSSENRVLQ